MFAAGNHGTSHQSSETKKKNTLWLDGLRGYAAFIVFLGHFGSVYWHGLAFVYGTQVPKGTTVPVWVPYGESTAGGKRIVDHSDQKNSYLLQLPILRLLYNGDAMVAFFFIISGYSLSIRPCTLIHQGRTAELLPAISSAILRRPIRLLLPVVVSTFIIALLFSVGAFAPAMSIQNGPSQDFHEYFHGYHKGNDFLVQPTFVAQMKHWFLSLDPLLEFFTQKRYPNSAYDGHVWTIPVEFRCSVLLYLTQMATALLDTRVRLTILGVLTIGAFTWGDAFEMALFWTGMSLCEINMTYRNTTGRRRHTTRKSIWLRGIGKISALFCGLYLASYPPVFPQYTPFYSTLASIKIPGVSPTGQWRFWESVGTIMCAVLISDSLPVQKLLSNRVARYLGRISFSLYLVHGAITRGFSQAFSVAL
ncbi:acyltransferase-like protein 6 [Elsinoe australis]|uniref:Acyltransferase-like protein 6 n=1 Tax=Elsinoe australis TaxID=40998 RepID=A0A4U7AQR2_9PEZI|nr:acyltransferase-like protein 6 [Elsinoe australis]